MITITTNVDTLRHNQTITPSIIEDDVQQHVEDTYLYQMIRDGKFAHLTYNQLTDSERRELYCSMFDPNYCN